MRPWTRGRGAHGLAQCSAPGAPRGPLPALHQSLSPKQILCSARREPGRVQVAPPASSTENGACPRQAELKAGRGKGGGAEP